MKCPDCPVVIGPCIRESTGHAAFCDWAASGDPRKRERIVALSTEPPTPAAYPPLAAQAANLAHDLRDWTISGFRMASADEVARRQAICEACPQWVAPDRRCRICGCSTDAKQRLQSAHCPLSEPRW